MFLDCESKCSKFGDVKDKAGKRLSHIRFSPYRGRLATREDSRAHPRGLPHCGKNAAKLAIIADKAQLFLKILSQARKNPPQAACNSRPSLRPAAYWHCFPQSTVSLQWSELEKALLRLQSNGAGALIAVNSLNPTERT